MCGTLRLAAGLLVASMNEMLIDAKEKIKSPDAFALKSVEIKANQLLGLEILSEVYMLAILNSQCDYEPFCKIPVRQPPAY